MASWRRAAVEAVRPSWRIVSARGLKGWEVHPGAINGPGSHHHQRLAGSPPLEAPAAHGSSNQFACLLEPGGASVPGFPGYSRASLLMGIRESATQFGGFGNHVARLSTSAGRGAAEADAAQQCSPLASAQSLRTLGVVGAGQMGSGIAQLGAMAGMDVVMVDVAEGATGRGMRRIQSSLERLVRKETLTQEDANSALGRISTSTVLQSLASADFVVEAVAESEELKRALFRQLDDVTPPHAVLASNTSSISITLIGAGTKKPDKVIGMHFMNPPPIMALVEIVHGLATHPDTTTLTEGLARRMGKTVCFARDHPGFIVNRLLMPMINEAFYALLEGVGTPEDIDLGMKLGTNQPMGPLTLADFIGLDTCVAIMRVLHTRLGDSKYRPCPLLVQYVDAGWLGRKTGRGVYQHPAE